MALVHVIISALAMLAIVAIVLIWHVDVARFKALHPPLEGGLTDWGDDDELLTTPRIMRIVDKFSAELDLTLAAYS